MLRQTSYTDEFTFFQKVRSFDFILLFCILILGVISSFSMYSTDGGELLYHTKSHLIKLSVFFVLMLLISFFNIKFRFSTVQGVYNFSLLDIMYTIKK